MILHTTNIDAHDVEYRVVKTSLEQHANLPITLRLIWCAGAVVRCLQVHHHTQASERLTLLPV